MPDWYGNGTKFPPLDIATAMAPDLNGAKFKSSAKLEIHVHIGSGPVFTNVLSLYLRLRLRLI